MTPPAWFKGDLTAWAIEYVRLQWIAAGIDADSHEDVMAVVGTYV